jgi:hypothetical protein
MIKKSLGVIVFVLCLATVLFAQDDSRPIITVLNFQTSGISDAEMRVFVDFIASHIIETGKYRVIDRAQRQAILSEIEFSQTDCSDEECQLEIGRMLSANQIIVGSLGTFGEKYILTIKLIDVETAHSVNARSDTYSSLEELLDDSKNLTARLVGIDEKPREESQSETASAGAAGRSSVEDGKREEEKAVVIPTATIKVDGRTADWSSVPPLIQDSSGDNWGAVSKTGTDIRRVYLARDSDDLYVRFDLMGGGPNSKLSSSRYVEYNVYLWKPTDDSEILLQTCFEKNRWRARLVESDSYYQRATVISDGTLRIRDDSFEAKYQLSKILEYVPSDRLLTITASIGYDDNGNWKQTDATIPVQARITIE